MWRYFLSQLGGANSQQDELEANRKGMERAGRIGELAPVQARAELLALLEIENAIITVERASEGLASDIAAVLPTFVAELFDQFSSVNVGEYYSISRASVRPGGEITIIGGDPQIEEVGVIGPESEDIFIRNFEDDSWKRRYTTVFHFLLTVMDECREIET